MSHEKNDLTAIDRLIVAFKDLRAGDVLYLDLDDTLFKKALSSEATLLSEKGLIQAIHRVQNAGIKVFALTARAGELAARTPAQLEAVGLFFERVLYAPTDHTNTNVPLPTKGAVLNEQLDELLGQTIKPKRVIVVDDRSEQLESIKQACNAKKIPLKLWHYVPQKKLNLNDTFAFPEDLEGYMRESLAETNDSESKPSSSLKK